MIAAGDASQKSTEAALACPARPRSAALKFALLGAEQQMFAAQATRPRTASDKEVYRGHAIGLARSPRQLQSRTGGNTCGASSRLSLVCRFVHCQGSPKLIASYPGSWTSRYFRLKYQRFDPVVLRVRTERNLLGATP